MSEQYIQIGQLLKNFRIKRKIPIEKISGKTKISIQNLNNIEEGKFHLLPGEFYQKSFVKSYCKALRISEKKILALFNDTSKTLDEEDEENDSYGKKINFLEKNEILKINKKIPTIPLVFVASLGLIALFLVNFFKDSVQSNEKLAIIEPKPDLKISKIEENLTNKIERIKQETPIKQTNINVDEVNDHKNQKNNFFLKQIIAKEDVWIEIKDFNQNILLSTILKKNEFFNLPNDNNDILISTSNAGALFVENGNNKQSDLGSFGSVLISTDLNSLITQH